MHCGEIMHLTKPAMHLIVSNNNHEEYTSKVSTHQTSCCGGYWGYLNANKSSIRSSISIERSISVRFEVNASSQDMISTFDAV